MRGNRAVYFANTATLEKIHGFKQHSVSPIILVVKFAIIFLLFLVATDSVQLFTTQIADNTEYVVMMDVSSSMANIDFDPDRLSAAKDIARSWVNKLPDNAYVSLLPYSQGIQNSFRFDQPREIILKELNDLDINYVNSTTNLDLALSTAYSYFTNTSNKTILLFTDSVDAVSETTIATAKNQNIRILVFGIGSDDQEELSEFYSAQNINFTTMESLANQTNGGAYRVSTNEALSDAVTLSTERETQVQLNTTFYALILICFFSILELVIYAKFGGL